MIVEKRLSDPFEFLGYGSSGDVASLQALQYRAHSHGAGSKELVLDCIEAASPFFETLGSRGFHMWALLFGAALSPERKSSFANYDLAAPLKKKGVRLKTYHERSFGFDGVERTIGLYLIDAEFLRNSFEFLDESRWSCGVLSNRKDFCSDANLGDLYRSAVPTETNALVARLDYASLSQATCPIGDVVVMLEGAFDDRERVLTFIYSRDKEVLRTAALRAIAS